MQIVKLTPNFGAFIYIAWGLGMCFSPGPGGSMVYSGIGLEGQAIEVKESPREILNQLKIVVPEKEPNETSKSKALAP